MHEPDDGVVHFAKWTPFDQDAVSRSVGLAPAREASGLLGEYLPTRTPPDGRTASQFRRLLNETPSAPPNHCEWSYASSSPLADGGDLHAIREIADWIEGKVPQDAELPRKADTAAGWLEDVNARRDTVIEVIDVKPCIRNHGSTKLIREFGSGSMSVTVGVSVGVSIGAEVK